MKYKIIVESEEVEDFRRDILIDEDATFLDLSNTILKSCDYPDDQMTSFYICENNWERRQQITRVDCSDIYSDTRSMEDTTLAEIIDEGYNRMEYVFDPINARTFLVRVEGEVQGYGEPEVVRSEGKAPKQTKDLDIVTKVTGDDLLFGDAFSDDEGFNSDEISLDGYEISDSI